MAISPSNPVPDPDSGPLGSFSYERLQIHRDARGWVVEPADADALRHQANSHLVLTEPGAIRGNHYHPRGAEISVITGPALVRIQRSDQPEDIEVASGEIYRFCFPPGLPHAMKNTGDKPMIVMAFNTIPHDPSNPDVVRKVLFKL